MSRFIFILFLVFLPFVIPVQAAPYDVWSSYYNLRSASQIVDAGDRVFALMNDNVVVYDVKTGEGFSTLKKIASTWDRDNMRIVDSTFPQGPRYITFASVLRYGAFPLPKIISRLLEIAKAEMKCDVEIEFAVDMDVPEDSPVIFNVLQIRPISTDTRYAEVDWDRIDTSSAFLTSDNALGMGWIDGVQDIVYLRPEAFDVLKTSEMAAEITALNSQMQKEGRGYLLIGFGRWGSSISSLGVPVRWSDISEARTIVECSLENFRVDPSQGTHFFQNLTSFNVGYINVDPWARGAGRFDARPAAGAAAAARLGFEADAAGRLAARPAARPAAAAARLGFEAAAGRLDFAALDALPALTETRYLRHVRLPQPLRLCVDGRRSRAFAALG